MIQLEGITKSFGALQVLKGIDLEIGKGEVVSIVAVRSVTSPCASLSVPAEESKGWSATIFYLLHSLIGKPKLILQIKNKPLTVSLLHFQSRPRGSKLHYILGRIYVRIYPLDKSATTIL